MEPMEIAGKLKEKFVGEIIDESTFRDQLSLTIKPGKILDICRFLHDHADIRMDFITDICGLDYPKDKHRFRVVYNLYSIKFGHRLLLKAVLPADEPSIDSVVDIWAGANWLERETCDMYGIVFNGHPDLRRILMPEDWEGYPLRKDYPLKGRTDWEYKGFEELKDLHSRDRDWNIMP